LLNIVRTSTSNIEYFGHRIFAEDIVKTLRVFGKMVARETVLHYCAAEERVYWLVIMNNASKFRVR